MNIIVMGPVGSGKSTQAALIAEKLGLFHFDVGEILRSEVARETVFGKKIKSYLNNGELISDDLLTKFLQKETRKHKEGFILDGAPRTLSQARILPFKIEKVFYLRVSDKETTKRLLKRRRYDDTPKLIKKRLDIYHQVTEPILDFFREKNKLQEIDGERSVNEIFDDINSYLP